MSQFQSADELIHYMREEYSSFGGPPCPLCEYKEGVFIKSCGPHSEVHALRDQQEDFITIVNAFVHSMAAEAGIDIENRPVGAILSDIHAEWMSRWDAMEMAEMELGVVADWLERHTEEAEGEITHQVKHSQGADCCLCTLIETNGGGKNPISPGT